MTTKSISKKDSLLTLDYIRNHKEDQYLDMKEGKFVKLAEYPEEAWLEQSNQKLEKMEKIVQILSNFAGILQICLTFGKYHANIGI